MSQEVTKRLTSGLKPTIYSIYIGVITHLEAFYQFPGISKEREFCENQAWPQPRSGEDFGPGDLPPFKI